MIDRRKAQHGRRSALAVAVALGGLSLALSGCLNSNFAYFSHRTQGTELYFKIPTSWKTFSAKQLVEASNGPLSQRQINQIEQGQWEMSFSAAPHPSPKQLIVESSAYPNGVVFAKQLSETDRDALSYAYLRAEILGQDPLSSSSSSSPFNVLSYTEFTRPGGYRGSRLVTNISEANGVIETYAQVVAVDPNTNYIYGVGISCRASCWGPNSSLINQVLNSWNVKEQSR
jgi:hypothetical protein